jgi:hypothetical protein
MTYFEILAKVGESIMILSRDSNIDGIRIGDWIYWPLTDGNYK